jgi:hypothetical protein
VFSRIMQGKISPQIAAAVCSILYAFWVAPVVAAKSPKDSVKQSQDETMGSKEDLKPKTMQEELQSASPAQRKQLEFVVGMQLHQLMYPGLEDLGRAVQMFQKDLGAEPTGDLSAEQMQELEKRYERLNIPNISFPTPFSSTGVNLMQKTGFAKVRGTAMLLDDEIAFPVNTVEINCYRSEGYCELLETYLAVIPAQAGGYTWAFDKNTVIFKVISWSADSIEAKEEDDPTNARTTSLSLNFKNKEFFWISKNSGNSNLRTGEKVEPLKRPRITQFVEGDKIVAAYFKKLKNDAWSFRSSEFRKKMEALMQER